MHLIDFIIFIVFTLGVVVFGCSFFKKGSSADEFTSAGHSIPGWVVGMSIFATYVSSISLHLLNREVYTVELAEKALVNPLLNAKTGNLSPSWNPIALWHK